MRLCVRTCVSGCMCVHTCVYVCVCLLVCGCSGVCGRERLQRVLCSRPHPRPRSSGPSPGVRGQLGFLSTVGSWCWIQAPVPEHRSRVWGWGGCAPGGSPRRCPRAPQATGNAEWPELGRASLEPPECLQGHVLAPLGRERGPEVGSKPRVTQEVRGGRGRPSPCSQNRSQDPPSRLHLPHKGDVGENHRSDGW